MERNSPCGRSERRQGVGERRAQQGRCLRLEVHPITVGKWRRRFFEWREDALDDEAISGRTANNRGCADRNGDHASAGERSSESDDCPPRHGARERAIGVQCVTDLACLRSCRFTSPRQHAAVLCLDEKSQIHALGGAMEAASATLPDAVGLYPSWHDVVRCCPGHRSALGISVSHV